MKNTNNQVTDQELFDQQRERLDLPNNATPDQVVRAHLANQLAETGTNGIGLSLDACGISQDAVMDIFTEYKFEMGPQYGLNYRTV